MALVKLNSAKSANGSINYANSRAVIKSGINCDPDTAKAQFEVTRKLWNKNDSIQAHTVIHSFCPGEVSPEKANELGRQLAEKIANGYEVAIFTHSDKDHVHNHIIINSVHPDTGKKYHCHGWKGLEKVRHQSNLISAENKLTVPYLPEDKRIYGEHAKYSDPSPVRYNQKEQAVIEKGKDSWKDEIRQAIDAEKLKASNYDEFKTNLAKEYGIAIKDSGKHIVFTHPERAVHHDKGRIRGYKLGEEYTKGGIIDGIERQVAENELRRRIEPTNEASSRSYSTVRAIIGENRTAEIERQRAVQQAADTHRQAVEAEQRRIAEADKRAREPKRDVPKPTRNRSWEPDR